MSFLVVARVGGEEVDEGGGEVESWDGEGGGEWLAEFVDGAGDGAG